MKKLVVRLLPACAVLAIAGCGGGGGTAGASLMISIPDGSRISAGMTLNLTAVKVFGAGTQASVTPEWAVEERIGSITEEGVFVASTTSATGTITATADGLVATIVVEIVSAPPLTDYRVTASEHVDVSSVPLDSEPYFYVTGEDGAGNRVYVPADPGSWTVDPPALGSVLDPGKLVPVLDGSATIAATAGGEVATGLSVTIVAPKVTISGKVADVYGTTGVDLSGAVVVFWNEAEQEVGRAVTGSSGTFSANISVTATHMYLEATPDGYFQEWEYGGVVYSTSYDPSTCKAPIPEPFTGMVLGTINLYPVGSPPPPPTC
jgi:hypothetical protein